MRPQRRLPGVTIIVAKLAVDFGTTQPQPWPRPQQPAGGLFDAGNSVFGLIRQAHVIIRSFVNCKNWDRALPSRFASGKFVGRDG